MSATPLDSLLLATASQTGLLAPASRPADARGDDFEDHLRDANKATETKSKPSEREATSSDNSPAAAKRASERRDVDAEEPSTDAEEQSSQPQAADKPSVKQPQADEETDQIDGDEVVVVTEENQSEAIVVEEAAVLEIETGNDSDGREAKEDESAADDSVPTDDTTQATEAVLNSEIPAPVVAPELAPAIAVGQGETAIVADSTSVATDVTEILPSDAQPVDTAQKAIAGDEATALATPTEIEKATSGEEIPDKTPNHPQTKSEQVATESTNGQADTLEADTSTDQDESRQEGSPRRSFGAANVSGEQTEAIAEKVEQPLATAKAELVENPTDINAQTSRQPAEPIANTAAPAENGRSEALLGALGKLQQSTGRTVQSSSESRPSNQPRVDSARFVGRVARAFQIAQDRGGTIQLRLSPPELGSLKLQVTIEQGVLSATIDAETDAARNALLDNLPALRAKLAEQDIRIEKFDVNVGREDGDSSQEFETQEREQRGNSPSRQALRGDNQPSDEQTVAAIDITEITTGDNNINLLI